MRQNEDMVCMLYDLYIWFKMYTMHIAFALIVNNRAQRVTATLITQTLQDHRSRKILEEALTHPPPLQ